MDLHNTDLQIYYMSIYQKAQRCTDFTVILTYTIERVNFKNPLLYKVRLIKDWISYINYAAKVI